MTDSEKSIAKAIHMADQSKAKGQRIFNELADDYGIYFIQGLRAEIDARIASIDKDSSPYVEMIYHMAGCMYNDFVLGYAEYCDNKKAASKE